MFPHVVGKLFGKVDDDAIIAMDWAEAAGLFGTDIIRVGGADVYAKYQLRRLAENGVEDRIKSLARQHKFGSQAWCLVFTQDRNDRYFKLRLRQCRSKLVVDLPSD